MQVDTRGITRHLGIGRLLLIAAMILVGMGILVDLCAAKATRRARGDDSKPNVVFIAVDDLNDWIGCMGGHPGSKTPHMDRLAQRGMLFEHAHCAAPICNPSRAAMMTGVLPSTSGVYANSPFFRKSAKLRDAVTIPQYFMKHGYHAMRGGKIFHHGRETDAVSWNEAFPSLKVHKPNCTVPPAAGKGKNSYKWKTGPLDTADEEMDDGKIATWATEQFAKKHDKPFFLAVGFYHPHLPWFAPKKYFDMHPLDKVVLPKVKDDDRDDIPQIAQRYFNNKGHELHKKIVKNGQWKEKVQAYQASISFVDAQIGRVLDALDRSAYADNTIIVLWSDHGWHLGEKQHWTKFTLWEESARVVLMMVDTRKTGSTIAKKARCQNPVGLIDVYPTLLDVCGLPEKDTLEGISLSPLLENPGCKWERPALTTHGKNNHTLRTKRWRYTRWSTGDEELYDHQDDPMEWTNLASDEKHTALKKELSKWFPKSSAGSSGGKKPKSRKKE